MASGGAADLAAAAAGTPGRHRDTTVPQLTPLQLDIHDAVGEIRPDHKILSVQELAGANTNNAFLVCLAAISTAPDAQCGSDRPTAKLVVRQAAADVEFIDRALEMDVLRSIPQWLGPKLLLATVGSRTGAALHVSEFLPGQDLDRIDVDRESDLKQIMHRLSTLHTMSIHNLEGRAPAIIRQLASFSHTCLETLKSRTSPSALSQDGSHMDADKILAGNLETFTVDFIESEVRQLLCAIVAHFGIVQQSGAQFYVNNFSHGLADAGLSRSVPKMVGLGHNDAQPGNWRRGEDGWLYLLDYEYADWNLVAGDIANTLAESAFAYIVPPGTPHGFTWKPLQTPTLDGLRCASEAYLRQFSLVTSQRSAHGADFELEGFSCTCCSSAAPEMHAVEQFLHDMLLLTPAVHLAWAAWAFDLSITRQPGGATDPFEFDYAAYAQCRLRAYHTSKQMLAEEYGDQGEPPTLSCALSPEQNMQAESLLAGLCAQAPYTPLFCAPRLLDSSSSASPRSTPHSSSPQHATDSPRGDGDGSTSDSFTTAHASPELPPFAPPPGAVYAPLSPLAGAVEGARRSGGSSSPSGSPASRLRSPGGGACATFPPWSAEYTPRSRARSAPAASDAAKRAIAAVTAAQHKLVPQASTAGSSPVHSVPEGELLRCLAAVSHSAGSGNSPPSTAQGGVQAFESPPFQGMRHSGNADPGSSGATSAEHSPPPSPPTTRGPSTWTTCMCVQFCGTRAYVPTVASVAMSVFGRALGSGGVGGAAAVQQGGELARPTGAAHSEVLRRVSPRGAFGTFWLDESLPVVEETDDSDDEGTDAHPSGASVRSGTIGVSPVASPTPTASMPASPARPGVAE